MSGYSDISFSQADGIAASRSSAGPLNAYRNETADELHDALPAPGQSGHQGGHLTGAGRAFSAGYDLLSSRARCLRSTMCWRPTSTR